MTPSQNNADNNETKKKVPYHFGEKLRQMREHKGYTLKYVAQMAGVSESLVSQIERNHVSPAIDTLLSLADVLDINLEFLFEEYRRQHPVQLIRRGERAKMAEGDVDYEELSKPDPNDKTNNFEAYIIRIPAHCTTHHGSTGHIGRELGIIVKGCANLHYENQVYTMNEGDSVSFPASGPHYMENIGDTELEAIWIVTPAQRFVRE